MTSYSSICIKPNPLCQVKEITCLTTIALLCSEYRDAFSLFDKRGDGKIDSDQVGDVLRALNLNPTEAEVKKIVQEIDPNGEQVHLVYIHVSRFINVCLDTECVMRV